MNAINYFKTTPRQPEDLGYLAAIIDGEGSISITRSPRPDGVRYSLRISIAMGTNEAVRWVHENFGGYLEKAVPNGKWSNHYPRWRVVFSNDAACDLLREIYPFLKVKKRQAALAFKFRKLMKQTLHSKDVHRNTRRDVLVKEMLLLNKPWLGAVETDTPASSNEEMIQSELIGDDKSNQEDLIVATSVA